MCKALNKSVRPKLSSSTILDIVSLVGKERREFVISLDLIVVFIFTHPDSLLVATMVVHKRYKHNWLEFYNTIEYINWIRTSHTYCIMSHTSFRKANITIKHSAHLYTCHLYRLLVPLLITFQFFPMSVRFCWPTETLLEKSSLGSSNSCQTDLKRPVFCNN